MSLKSHPSFHQRLISGGVWPWLSNLEAFPGLREDKIRSPSSWMCWKHLCRKAPWWGPDQMPEPPQPLSPPRSKPIPAARVSRPLRSAVTHHSWPQVRAGTKATRYTKSFPLQLSSLLCQSKRKTAPAAISSLAYKIPRYWNSILHKETSTEKLTLVLS